MKELTEVEIKELKEKYGKHWYEIYHYGVRRGL